MKLQNKDHVLNTLDKNSMRQSQKENEDINERYQGNSSDESVYK